MPSEPSLGERQKEADERRKNTSDQSATLEPRNQPGKDKVTRCPDELNFVPP